MQVWKGDCIYHTPLQILENIKAYEISLSIENKTTEPLCLSDANQVRPDDNRTQIEISKQV